MKNPLGHIPLTQLIELLDALIVEHWAVVTDKRSPDAVRAQARGALLAYRNAKNLISDAIHVDEDERPVTGKPAPSPRQVLPLP